MTWAGREYFCLVSRHSRVVAEKDAVPLCPGTVTHEILTSPRSYGGKVGCAATTFEADRCCMGV